MKIIRSYLDAVLEKDIQVTKVTFGNVVVPQYTCLWFYNLTNLTTINNIEKLDTSNTISMRNMFRSTSALEKLDLSSFDTENVTDMFAMFQSCTNLKFIDVSNFDTSKVSNMSSMFFRCESLKKIYVSNSFVTTSVTDSRGMFQYCSLLVGNNGTKFDSSKNDATMAKIDTAVYDVNYNLISGTPGYFSTK